MLIAITSQNFKTITGHAGQTRRFLVYETDAAGSIQEMDRIDLPQELTMHEYRGGEHPLFNLNLHAVITQSAGPGFVQRLAQHGITVHITSESDPLAAVSKVATGQPLPAIAVGQQEHVCSCQGHKH